MAGVSAEAYACFLCGEGSVSTGPESGQESDIGMDPRLGGTMWNS